MILLKYQETIKFIKTLIMLTESNTLIWHSNLISDKLRYQTSIPNTNMEVIIYNPYSTPDIFVRTQSGIRQLRLVESVQTYDKCNHITVTAEEIAIDLGVAVLNQIYNMEIQQIDTQIKNYIKLFNL